LPFGGAVNAGVGPVLFPVVQVSLGFFQAFKALSLQRSFLGMANAGLDLPFGEKCAMQTVVMVANKFSPSRTPSIR